MSTKKRRAAKSIPLQPIVPINPSAGFGGAFDTAGVVRVVAQVGLPLRVSTTWLREALNTACLEFFSNFGMSKSGAPAEQAEWVADFEAVCGTLLQMLAPNSASRPHVADHRVHSILFNWGELDGTRDALDAAARNVWDLQQAARFAREQWRLESGKRPPRPSEGVKDVAVSRHYAVDRAVRTWIAAVAYFYECAFCETAPLPPPQGSRFARFAEAVRRAAMEPTGNTSYGTDELARERLRKLTSARLRRYVRDNAEDFAKRVEIIRAKDFVPPAIHLKIQPDFGP